MVLARNQNSNIMHLAEHTTLSFAVKEPYWSCTDHCICYLRTMFKHGATCGNKNKINYKWKECKNHADQVQILFLKCSIGWSYLYFIFLTYLTKIRMWIITLFQDMCLLLTAVTSQGHIISFCSS
jgi:hypothetical protein